MPIAAPESRTYLRLRAAFAGLAVGCGGLTLASFRITASNGTRSSAYSDKSIGFGCLAGLVIIEV